MAGGGIRETSCSTAYSVRGFVRVGGQKRHSSWNYTSSSGGAIYIHPASSYPEFKHTSTSIAVDLNASVCYLLYFQVQDPCHAGIGGVRSSHSS